MIDPRLRIIRSYMRKARDAGDLARLDELTEELQQTYLETVRGVTPGGLPYPDPGDPVADGANATRALAEALDPKVADTGWLPLTLGPGWQTPTGASQASICRIGRQIFLSGEVFGGTTGTIFAYIPDGFRPRTRIGDTTPRASGSVLETYYVSLPWPLDALYVAGANIPTASPGISLGALGWLRD